MPQSLDLPIALPPWNGLGKKLESAVRKALLEHSMLEGVSRLGIALSGGKDSLAMLYLLKAISGRGLPPFDIVAINVDGEFTCGAGVGESFVKKICERLEIPLIVKKSLKTLEELECYSCSRERRSLLFRAAKEAGCEAIAFGHHQDDHVQTVLMNLFHKGEFAGLLPKLPMVHYEITILRPLIYITEEEIRTFARHYGFARITCQCPVGQNSVRKKTQKLLQDIEELYPHAHINIANAAFTYGSDKAKTPRKRSPHLLHVVKEGT